MINKKNIVIHKDIYQNINILIQKIKFMEVQSKLILKREKKFILLENILKLDVN